MKTLQEVFKEIEGSESLKNELKEIKDKVAFVEFLKKRGCEATAEEIAKFSKLQGEGEIEDDAAAAAAGGEWPEWANPFKWFG